jgi:ATP-dependent helicase Lhr and Lhr-like helicase
VAFYLADDYPLLAPPGGSADGELCAKIRDLLTSRGALFFTDVVAQLGGFPADTLQALWALVWAGEVTNDTLLPLRGRLSGSAPSAARAQRRRPSGRPSPGSDFRSRRGSALLGAGMPGSEGRWTRLPAVTDVSALHLKRRAEQLLLRYGIVPREVVAAAFGAGGFSAAYPILAALEDAGRVRRGSFVAELGPMQFALPPADSQVRAPRGAGSDSAAVILSALDPANPFGQVLPWPELSGLRSQRSAGASVILWQGELLAYVGKGRRAVWTASDFETREVPQRSALLRALSAWFDEGSERAWLIEVINGEKPDSETLNPGGRWLVSELLGAGFALSALGLQKRRTR